MHLTSLIELTSAIIQDSGKKVLYLKQDDKYDWKIIYEGWSKLDSDNEVAFTPMMRFFDKSNKDVKNDS